MIGTDGGDGLRTMPLPPKPLDPIAGRLVDVWGRKIGQEMVAYTHYYQKYEKKMYASEILPKVYAYMVGKIRGYKGLCKFAGVSISMEVVTPQ